MFEVRYHGSQARLEYIPFRTMLLPDVVRVYDQEEGVNVPITSGQHGRLLEERPLYHLRWPGVVDRPTLIPSSVIDHERGWPVVELDAPNSAQSHYELRFLVERNALPVTVPGDLAYHLAVNRDRFFGGGPFDDGRVRAEGEPIQLEPLNNNGRTPHPIGGLPEIYVNIVLNQTFALPEGYLAAINYMKWMFETHWGHPLLSGGFDTMVREHLLRVAQAAHESFFFMLGDAVWHNGEPSDAHAGGQWSRCARYMHWNGRTGGGLIRGFSDLDDAHTQRQWPDLYEEVRAYHAPEFRRAFEESAAEVPDNSGVVGEGDSDTEPLSALLQRATETVRLSNRLINAANTRPNDSVEPLRAPTGDVLLDLRLHPQPEPDLVVEDDEEDIPF